MQGSLAAPRSAEFIKDMKRAVSHALAHPVDSPPLRAMAKPGQKACILFTDSTRASPDHQLVPALLEELESAGVRSRDILLLCATGMHRPSTAEEKLVKVGKGVHEKYRILDHEPMNPDSLVDLGFTENGVPLVSEQARI